MPTARTTWHQLLAFGAAVGASGVTNLAAATRHARFDCPLEVRRVYLAGKAPQVIVRNKAKVPVGGIVLHVAYQDLFNKYHEPTQAFDTVVQPDQRVTLSFAPIQGSVEWETMNVFATCQAADSLPPADTLRGR